MTELKEKPRVLAVCPPPGIVAFLRKALDVTIEPVRTKTQAQDFITNRQWDLSLFHHRGLAGGAEPFLSKIRQLRPGTLIPIVYCLGKDMDPDLTKKLVKDFGVQSLLTYPQDPQEIAHHIADLLSLPPRHLDHASGSVSPAREESCSDRETQWESFKVALKEQAATLERAATDLLEGTFRDETRQEALRQSRRLAQDAGGYGLAALARPATEAEQLLRREETWTPSRVLRFCEVIVELQEQVDRLGTLSTNDLATSTVLPLVLVISRDEAFLHRLQSDAPEHAIRMTVADSVEAAAEAMAVTSPASALLDIGGDGASRQELDFVGDLSAHTPSIPVLVLTEGDAFKDRVSVAGAGGLGVLDKRDSASAIFTAVKEVLGQNRPDVSKILVVDDSELVCRLASKLLERRGFHVTTLGISNYG